MKEMEMTFFLYIFARKCKYNLLEITIFRKIIC